MQNIGEFFIRLNWTNRLFMLMALVLLVLTLQKQFAYKSWAREKFMFNEVSPEKYPARPLQTEIILDDGREFFYYDSDDKPDEPIYARWGWSSGYKYQFERLPARLELDWISLAEGKFYRGSFELPKKKRDSIFRNISRDQWKHWWTPQDSFLAFTIGYAPGGMVVVWIAGHETQVELARFQGEAYEPDTDRNFRGILGKEKYLERLYENIDSTELIFMQENHPNPSHYWDRLRQRYDYELEIIYPGDPDKTHIEYLNKEQQLSWEKKFSQQQKAVPESITIGVFEQKKDNRIMIRFDEEETVHAFEAFSEKATEPFHVEVDLRDRPKIVVFNSQKRQELQHYKIRFK